MTTPAQTQTGRRSSLRQRLFQLPLPSVDPGDYEWIKRFFFAWLIPVGAASYATYKLAFLLIRSLHWDGTHGQQLDPIVTVVKAEFGITNMPLYLWANIIVLVALLISTWDKYIARKGMKISIRTVKYLHPINHWLGMLAIKLLSVAVSPLIVVLAFSNAVGVAPLTATATFYLVIVVFLCGCFHNLVYNDVRPPASFALMFEWRNEDNHSERTWDKLNDALRDDVLEISDALGGIWRDNVTLEEDLTHATIVITARSSVAEWGPKKLVRVRHSVRNIMERWRKAGYRAQSSRIGGELADRTAPSKPKE